MLYWYKSTNTDAIARLRAGNVDNYKQHIRAALQAFEKLNSILSDAPECTWNIASIYDELAEMDKKMIKKASAAYKRLIAQV